jgi:hypothetical protein
MKHGIMLLETDETDDIEAEAEVVEPLNFELTDTIDVTPSTYIPPKVRRAVIVEKSQGLDNVEIAMRWDISTQAVARIWRDFVDSTSDTRQLGDENPDVFRKKIRRKAVKAIENGLDCDRDPYRQAGVGVQVMKGIGEFATESNHNSVRVNVLLNAVPNEWKQRYIASRAEGNKEKDNG